jgi:hypothetical protein
VLEALLEFLGPVELSEYDMEISAENFRDVLQNYVEFEYDEELNQPKKVIADLAPILLEELKQLSPAEYLELSSYLSDLLAERDVLLAHSDESVHKTFDSLGWAGGVVETDTDYLAVVHTNLAGGKTDGVIQDDFDLSVHIDEYGQATHTLTIRREHTGQKGIPLIGVRNVDYLRVYVPAGSELIAADGFDRPPSSLFESPEAEWKVDADLAASEKNYQIHEESGVELFEESGKQVFAHWVQTDPGEVSEVKLIYRVPDVITKYMVPEKEASWTDWFTGETAQAERAVRTYQLYWQKQSGSWSPELSFTVNYPQDWQLEASSELSATRGTGSWNTRAVMEGDALWGFIMY